MGDFLTTLLLASGVFAACITAMAVGLLVRGAIMRGGCRGEFTVTDGERQCATCGSGKRGRCNTDEAADVDQPGNPSDRHSV